MAMIINGLASQIGNILVDLIKDEVSMMMTVKSDLQRLEKQVRMIQCVLEDAESKAFNDKAVRAWLSELRDALYDADDIIDFSTTKAQALAKNMPAGKYANCYVHLVFIYRKLVFRHQIGGGMRSLNERLSEIFDERSKFGLVAAAPASTTPTVQESLRIIRTADPNVERDIVGFEIEDATNDLVSKLTESTHEQEMLVLGIVGMGGIGKTTLAQKINNHRVIRDNFQFPPPIWISVSKIYSDADILKSMVKQVGGDQSTGIDSVGELQHKLGESIQRKKVFLILDDVWDSSLWEELLKKPLQNAGTGSRVLVTTRDENIAKRMGSVHLHRVRPLSMGDGWSLLGKLVFKADERGDIQAFQDIGMQIAAKCDGLPLAIKTIAGVLMEKERRPAEWEKVLKNLAWSMKDLPQGVMRVLYLSYENLPSPLKQCFVFCSLFPQGFSFTPDGLVQHWVAQGFVEERQNMQVEEVAEGYYNELLRRNLLQRDPYNDRLWRMHDLLRSLAQYLSPDEYFVGNLGDLSSQASRGVKLRHLSIVGEAMEEFPELVKEQTCARTLLFIGTLRRMKQLPHDVFHKLCRLRALDLSWTEFTIIPDSLGNLVHLRKLVLLYSNVKELPETIGELSNLQYLILQQCKNLCRLPRSIAKLSKLRSIDLLDTPVLGVPAGIGGLLHLNTIEGFVVSESENEKGEWASLDEIKPLLQLRSITIANLDKATTKAESQGAAVLKDKRFMFNLALHCNDRELIYLPEDIQRIKEVFDKRLCPPSSVEKLEILGYFGSEFPSWMMKNDVAVSTSNLRRLVLSNFRFSSQLPPLGQLPQLEYLRVVGAGAIKSIGPELMGNASVPFPKLKELILENLPFWMEWRSGKRDTAAMPHLQTLWMTHCPNLRALPTFLHHSKALTSLVINSCHSIRAIQGLTSLKTAHLINNFSLSTISNLLVLRILVVHECPALLHKVVGLPSLEILEWANGFMESLPDWFLSNGQKAFPVLERFYGTFGNVNTLRRCLEDGVDWQKIRDVSHVSIQVMNRPEFIFYTKKPFKFHTNLEAIKDGASDGGD